MGVQIGTLKSYILSFFISSDDVTKSTEKLSISDGSFWAIYSSMTTPFLVPLSIPFFGKNAPIGYITGIPVFLVPLAQFYAVRFTKRSENLKKLTVFITFLDRLLWIPVILLIFIPDETERLLLMVLLLSLRTFFASASSTTWTLWVPTIIPTSVRNKYFSQRNFIMKIFSLVGYFIALFIFAGIRNYTVAMLTVFLVGVLLFSTISLAIMTQMPSFALPVEERREHRKTDIKFKSFIIFIIIFYLGSSLLMPYFQLYILSSSYLNLSTYTYTIIFIIISISAITSQLYWGRIADKYGLRRTIIINLFLTLLLILLIIDSKNLLEIISPSIVIGVTQSGLGLTLFNEMIGRSTSSRITSVSMYNLSQSLASASGPILGNIIFDFAPNHIVFIFLVSLVLVTLSTILFLTEHLYIKDRS
ncbi:MFS transporter [Cuniculiplasma sp. SKW3]|uniref:MFS transporter n=1 Tax=Cuniculiplasma sp. SKW3 TaxID=3400170 RepID=UPI003FD06D59